MKQMIEAGAAAVHFEDQLSSAKNAVIWVEKFWFLHRKPSIN
jgi:2-methylisocitrate lyase-like PEP mutase family enzyme